MPRRCLLLALVVACGAPTPEDRAIAYMNAAEPSRDPSCFAYMREDDDANGIVVAVREVHSDICGGDPGVEPVIARLRVTPAGAVERYDVAENTWR